MTLLEEISMRLFVAQYPRLSATEAIQSALELETQLKSINVVDALRKLTKEPESIREKISGENAETAKYLDTPVSGGSAIPKTP